MIYDSQCTLCKWGERENILSRCLPARMALEDREVTKDDKIDTLLVVEAPTMASERTGRGFSGSAGGLLRKSLEILVDVGLDASKVACTYAVKCCPADGKKPGLVARRTCLPYLLKEIEVHRPSLVLALGGGAAAAITEGEVTSVGPNRLAVVGSFHSEAGAVRYVADEPGTPAVSGLAQGVRTVLGVVYHPAAVFHNRGLGPDFLDDLNWWLVEKGWHPENQPDTPIELPVRLVNTHIAWGALRRRLAVEDTIGLDIETDGFTPYILTIALAVPGEASYVVAVRHPESKLNAREVIEWVVDRYLMNPQATVIGQNIKYDIGMLMRAALQGVVAPLCRTKDSMLYHYMLNEHSQSRNLDYLSRAYSQIGGYKDEVDHGNLINEPLKLLAKYNGRDAALPLEIIGKIGERLKAMDCYSPQMVGFYSKLSPFVAQMEASGVRVDAQALEREGLLLDNKIKEMEEELQKQAPGINLGSSKQLSDFIFEVLHLPVPDVKDAVGKSGQISTRADVIAQLDHPFTTKLLEFRHLQKLRNTYIKQIYEALEPNSFVHPSYFVAKTEFGGTVTGRLSCKRPAMQTIPKGASLRSVFVPRYEGGLLLGIDASQAELRVAASYSEDETLVDLFNSGADLHQATADACGVDRSMGKRINFASIYGVSQWGLEEKAGLSPGKAKFVAGKMRKEWASLYAYFDSIKTTATLTGKISTPYGRWRRVPGANSVDPKGRMLLREAVNFVIQSSASDFVQLFGYHAAQRLTGIATPILSNHDGLVFDIFHERYLDDVMKILLTTTEEFAILVESTFGVKLRVPFLWDYEQGPNLFEMKELQNAS